MTEYQPIFQLAKDLTVTGILLFIIWATIIKDPPILVPWNRFKEAQDRIKQGEERETYWRSQALDLLRIGASAVNLAEKKSSST